MNDIREEYQTSMFVPAPESIVRFDPALLARRDDPQTSKDAAASLCQLSALEALLLIEYGKNPQGLTDNEAGDLIGYPTAHKRCATLRNRGLIDPVLSNGKPLTRENKSGRRGMVCAITDLGREQMR